MADRQVDRDHLKFLRESQLLTQRALAERAGVSERTVKYAEAGPHQPTGIVLHRLALALGVEIGELLAAPGEAAA